MRLSTGLLTLLIIFPMASMADSSQPKTREQVRNELAQLRAAGYDPINWPGYPDNLTTAIAKLNASHRADLDGQVAAGDVGTSK